MTRLRRTLFKTLLATALAGSVCLGAFRATAQTAADRTTARALANEGQAAFESGDYETAADRFARADALVHAPTLLLALARAQVKLGQVVQAYENYNRILREGVAPGSPEVFEQALQNAEREIGEVEAQLAWVTLHVEGPRAPAVKIGDTEVPVAALGVRRAVNPGDHRVTASASGYLPAQGRFSVAKGEATELTLVLKPDPAARADARATAELDLGGSSPLMDRPAGSSWQRTTGFIGLGVGAAGIAVGAIAGVIAVRKHGELVDACPDGICPPSQEEALDSYRLMGTLSTVGFIAGAVGGVAGMTLLLTAPSATAARPTRHLGLGVGPAGMTLRGRF